MSRLRDELASWRNVSRMLDKLRTAKKENGPTQTCPFCRNTHVRVETMETISGSDKGLRIGFFSCPSCNQSWSDLIQ
jgi:transcription elongation factor Elf1